MMLSLFLALLQLVLILKISIDEVNRKSPAAFLWATLLLMFGITHFIDVFTHDVYSEFSESVKNEASLFVILFCIFYYVTRNLLVRNTGQKMRNTFLNISRTHMMNDKEFFALYIILVFVSAHTVLRSARIAGGILNTKAYLERSLNFTRSYVSGETLVSIFYMALSGLFLCALIRKEYAKAVVAAMCIIMVTLITRARFNITPLLIGIIVPPLIKLKRINISALMLGITGLVMTIFVVYGLLIFRHYGSTADFLERFSISDLFTRIVSYLKEGRGELTLKNTFYYFIKHDNSFPAFGTGGGYIRMLMVFIPTRFSFGLKPDDFAIAMGSAIGMGPGGSMHPTLFGDCYANLGFAGTLFGIFWAVLATYLDKIILSVRKNELRVLTYSLVASMFSIIGRGAVYNAFFTIVYGTLVIIFLDRSPVLTKKFWRLSAR